MSRASPAFWRISWAFAIALAWLLPNHYRPWLSFFPDAWISTWVLLAGLVVFSSQRAISVPPAAVWACLFAAIPWAQYAAGQLPAAGFAWLYSLMVLGFALAIVLGAHWEKGKPGVLPDAIFLAVGVASVLSVSLQMYQRLEGSHLGIAVMWSPADRPFANLGQPNQLATLLLLGLLAVLWGVERAYVRGWVAALAAIYLLWGIALTGSRAAWVGLGAMLLLVVLQRKHWRMASLPAVAWVLCAVFVGFTMLQAQFGVQSFDGIVAIASAGTRIAQHEVRIPMYQAMLDAIALRPWTGWGVGQVGAAQIAVALQHPNLAHMYSYAHNLVLDLWLWLGLPLGSVVLAALSIWAFAFYRRLADGGDVVLFLVPVVLVSHAMFEMPLYYAYFLLPLGLLLGVLHVRCGIPAVWQVTRSRVWAVLLALVLAWGVLLRDYARVEVAFAELENEWHRIQVDKPAQTPELVMLDQWQTYFDAMRTKPAPRMSEADLVRMQQGLLVHPSLLGFQLLASSLLLNDRPDEARDWLLRACKAGDCTWLKDAWAFYARRDPRYAAVLWPLP